MQCFSQGEKLAFSVQNLSKVVDFLLYFKCFCQLPPKRIRDIKPKIEEERYARVEGYAQGSCSFL